MRPNSYELNASGLAYDVQPYKSMRFVGPFELRTVKISQVVFDGTSSPKTSFCCVVC